ncbi:zinc-ribbon domain-containing protein [Marisediminicola sp. LYQ85]|uniref:zinc-ribbon domain-containing protein n=1 Tax=Marisediminicola sp. LYQ85 TaxID=3391062 RepID=UPI003982F740
MFLLFGTNARDTVLTIVHFVCGYCSKAVAQRVIKNTNRFTLFFIPLFPVSTSYVNVCTNCGGVTKITKDQADNALQWAATHAQ